MKRCLSLLLATGLSLVTACAQEPGKAAPAWQLQDLDGQRVDSSQFKNRVVLVDFWATWCPPCRAEIPELNQLQMELAGEGFTIVGVSLDTSPAEVKRFLQKQPINYPVVMGTQEVANQFGGIQAIPTKFLIDREGRIVSKSVGGSSKAELVRKIRPLLDKKQ